MRHDHGLDLFRVVYVSRAVLPSLPAFAATVKDVLSVARPNNQRLGITGMLVAHAGWFLQCLEGPRRNVSIVFGAIGRDLRHAQMELVEGASVNERLFGAWAMHAQAVTPESAPILRMLDLAPDFDPFQLDAVTTLRLLSAIAQAPLKKAG